MKEDEVGEQPPQTNKRLCPMCEANFPSNEILQEDFEAHVLGHFNYEEEDDLSEGTNIDINAFYNYKYE